MVRRIIYCSERETKLDNAVKSPDRGSRGERGERERGGGWWWRGGVDIFKEKRIAGKGREMACKGGIYIYSPCPSCHFPWWPRRGNSMHGDSMEMEIEVEIESIKNSNTSLVFIN